MKQLIIAVVCMLVLCSCQSLSPSFEKPTASIEAVELLSSNPLSPGFKVKLRIVNPNNFTLPVAGLSYVVELNGIDVITGVTNSIPKIGAYADIVVPIDARLSMIQAARLFMSIPTQTKTQDISFNLKAKLDLTGAWPSVNIVEKGVIPLEIP